MDSLYNIKIGKIRKDRLNTLQHINNLYNNIIVVLLAQRKKPKHQKQTDSLCVWDVISFTLTYDQNMY